MKKKKTTVVMPATFAETIEKLSDGLGIGKNAVMCLALGFGMVDLAKAISPGRRRLAALRDVETTFQKFFSEVKNS